MAQYFGAKSVEEFSAELVGSDSAQRLHRLREFYNHISPDLTDVIQQTFSQPAPERNAAGSSSTAARSTTRQNSLSKRARDDPIRKAHHKEAAKTTSLKKRRTKAPNITDLQQTHQVFSSSETVPQTSRDCQRVHVHTNPSRTLKDGEPGRAQRNSSAEPAHFSKDDTAGTDADHSHKNLIDDLIGDTSILDDLFKPKRSADRTSTAPPASTPAARTTDRTKDFWDILNEGNEESINKLTDLSRVEKMCRTVTVPAKSKCENSSGSSQLWKRNEKFLWK